jgi:putative superfamily III holin-X
MGMQHPLPVESAEMTDRDEIPPRQSALALARRLISGLVALAKLELQHARQEIGAMLGEAGMGVALVAAGFVVLLVSLATLDVAIVLGVAALFEALPGVVVAILTLIVFVGMLIVALVTGTGAGVPRPPGWAVGAGVLVVGLLAVAYALPAYLGFRAAWLTALFVFTTQLLVALLIAWRGVRRIKIGPPTETIASVQEEVAWAKRLLRRG